MHADGISYRDETGNITTASLRRTNTSTVVELKTRFPMFGGWRNRFELTYTLPAGAAVGTSAAGWTEVTLPVGIPIQGSVALRLTTRVAVPVGSSGVKFEGTPGLPEGAFEESPRETLPRHLDIVGREVVVLTATQPLVPHHASLSLRLRYSAGWAHRFRRPLVIAATAACLFGGLVGLALLGASQGGDETRLMLERCVAAVQAKASALRERDLKAGGDRRLALCDKELEGLRHELDRASRADGLKLRRVEEAWPSLEEARAKAARAKTDEAWADLGAKADAFCRSAREALLG